jgi:hypothetical protein
MRMSGSVGDDENGGGTTLAGTLITTRQARDSRLTHGALEWHAEMLVV